MDGHWEDDLILIWGCELYKLFFRHQLSLSVLSLLVWRRVIHLTCHSQFLIDLQIMLAYAVGGLIQHLYYLVLTHVERQTSIYSVAMWQQVNASVLKELSCQCFARPQKKANHDDKTTKAVRLGWLGCWWAAHGQVRVSSYDSCWQLASGKANVISLKLCDQLSIGFHTVALLLDPPSQAIASFMDKRATLINTT